jgi:hypothetical protein
MPKSILTICILGALLMAISDLTGAEERGSPLAFMFAYTPKTGAKELANGYMKHLEWHDEINDPILWYGWFVVEGDRLDYFIDGAFDITGDEFDSRPDPAGDAEDASATFAPTAAPVYRQVNRLREDLGTSRFLEDRNPSPLMQVVYYDVKPGKQIIFEDALQEVARAARPEGLHYAVYESLTGTSGTVYSMYIPMAGFRDFDNSAHSIESVARATLSGDSLASTMTGIAAAADSIYSEVWQYRSDLSLVPEPK